MPGIAFMTRNGLAALAVVALTSLVGAPGAPGQATDAAPTMPQREIDLIQVFSEARRDYEAAHTDEERQSSRLLMQSRILHFMQQDNKAQGWRGIVRERGSTADGDEWLSIQIAPGLTVRTARSRTYDPEVLTMIKRDSYLHDAAHRAQIGQAIVFDAKIVRSPIGDDDQMVKQPELIAIFTQLELNSR